MKNPIKTKRAAVVTLAAVATLGAATIAWAAFNSTATSVADSAATETFTSVTVTGEWKGRWNGASYVGEALLPGESGDVRLVLTNPASNTVNGRVISISPVAVGENDIGGAVAGGDRATCAGELNFASYTPFGNPNDAPVLNNNGSGVALTLKNAVTLNGSATEICQGMTFPVAYTVTFQATRDNAGGLTTFNPLP